MVVVVVDKGGERCAGKDGEEARVFIGVADGDVRVSAGFGGRAETEPGTALL